MIDNDPLDPRTAAFLDDLRATYGSVPVEPDARLTALFAADTIVADTIVIPSTPRRPRMLSDLLKSLPGKVAAGLVGATLAWSGLGVAGAMPGPLSLASSDEEIGEPALDETEVADETDADAEDTDDDGDEDETAPDATELPEAPTTVSEAAHIHDFDEACGNHGKYVSHYARFGEEPDCATGAREEAAAQDQEDADDDGDEDTDEVTIADGDDGDDKGKGKNEKSKKATSKGGKGKGRR